MMRHHWLLRSIPIAGMAALQVLTALLTESSAAPAHFTASLQLKESRNFNTLHLELPNGPCCSSVPIQSDALENSTIVGANNALIAAGQALTLQFGYDTAAIETSLDNPYFDRGFVGDPLSLGRINGATENDGFISSLPTHLTFTPSEELFGIYTPGSFTMYGLGMTIPAVQGGESILLDLASDIVLPEDLFTTGGLARPPALSSLPVHYTVPTELEYIFSMSLNGGGGMFVTGGALPSAFLLDDTVAQSYRLFLSYRPELIVLPEDYATIEDFQAVNNWVTNNIEFASSYFDWQFSLLSIQGGVIPEPSSLIALFAASALVFLNQRHLR